MARPANSEGRRHAGRPAREVALITIIRQRQG